MSAMVWNFLGGLLFLGLGGFLFFRPELVWKLTEQWKSYYADEPSDLYRLSTKVGGVMLAALGVAMIALPFLLD